MKRKYFHMLIIFPCAIFQTITGAMSTLSPPVALEKPENQARVDYIQDYASGEWMHKKKW